jgi:hypothetical protein
MPWSRIPTIETPTPQSTITVLAAVEMRTLSIIVAAAMERNTLVVEHSSCRRAITKMRKKNETSHHHGGRDRGTKGKSPFLEDHDALVTRRVTVFPLTIG